jgi:predicted enzyme related to lactoylglutathione lyase
MFYIIGTCQKEVLYRAVRVVPASIDLDSWGKMKLKPKLALIPVLVKDQEEALKFYTEKLGLEKRSDITFGPGLRLLTVAPRGQKKPEIALAQPAASRQSEERDREWMEQGERNVPWIFRTDDCRKTYETLCARGVKFLSAPTEQLYGLEAVFEDPYGNTFALIQASPEARSLLANRSIGTAA